MDVGGRHFRTIWVKPDDEGVVQLIDQRFLPHRFTIEEVHSVEQMATAIREMHVRGAGLIGVSAGFGMYLAAIEAAARAAASGFDERVAHAAEQLKATRPTAVNLSWAIERELRSMADGKTAEEKVDLALRTANSIAEEDVEHCRAIGQHGLKLIKDIARSKRATESMCSRIATRGVSPSLITAPQPRRSMPRTITAWPYMFGYLRRDPEIRAQNLLPGNWASTACRTR